MNPEEKNQSLNLAEYYFRANNYEFSEHMLDKVLKVDPLNSKANELLSYIYGNMGKFDDSFELLNVACNQIDCSPEALYYLGSLQLKRKLFCKAKKSFQKSISKGGEFFEALHDLATTQSQLGDNVSALLNYKKCLKFNRASHELFYNIARVFDDLRSFDEAIAHYDKALSLQPDFIEAWSNKGVALNELKRYDEAIAHYDNALSLKIDFVEGWFNKGNTLRALKRYDEAIAHYDKALSLKPDLDWTYADSIHTKMKICSWPHFVDVSEFISKKVEANEKVSQPFSLLALVDDPVLHKKSSEIYIESKFPFNDALGPIPKHPKSQKIRIAYFSADFHNHATGYLMAELFELHDKTQFELIGFSFGPTTNDDLRQRLAKSFDQFIEVGNKSDAEVARLSRTLKIDIAVDLKGFTQDSRTGVFAHRAAPIQVNYLGYPGTMGADYMDYIIADQTLVPSELVPCYSEKVVCLPNSYQVNDRKRLVSERQFTRKELGLPEDGFVFCCFNNSYKILPSTFDVWMEILKSVDGSVLWLLQDNHWAVENLKNEALSRGVEANRLIFAERMQLPEHLARHRQADLFLDTLPYNAHTTASDALWVGLPVLTSMGKSFASRVSASLLNAVGLPELITNTQEDFEAMAIELATNPKKLAELKLKLANNRLTTPLFDTPLFTKNLEAAYLQMYERYQQDLEPDHFFIN